MWPESHHHYHHHHLIGESPLRLRPTQMSVGMAEVAVKRRAWAHPFDARGQRHDCSRIPRLLTQLQDDPYRTLANRVHAAGGYAKSPTLYAEFLWADFLRTRVGIRAARNPTPAAVRAGVKLARSPAARYLPGWAGRDP